MTSDIYVITRRKGEAVDLYEAHRRPECARRELARMREDAKADGSKTMLTQAGCCLRVQKGESVSYYEINKIPLK